MELVRTVYDEVHLALWAMLTAFAIYFVLFVVPKLPELSARAERLQLQEIAAADEAFCTKLHMSPGAAMHEQCISDLQRLRTKIQNRMAEEFEF
jgi:hypothetical protein